MTRHHMDTINKQPQGWYKYKDDSGDGKTHYDNKENSLLVNINLPIVVVTNQ